MPTETYTQGLIVCSLLLLQFRFGIWGFQDGVKFLYAAEFVQNIADLPTTGDEVLDTCTVSLASKHLKRVPDVVAAGGKFEIHKKFFFGSPII